MQPPTLRPLKPENVEALRLLLNDGLIGEAQAQAARECYRDFGRGLFLHIFADGLVGSMKPPDYLTLNSWNEAPLTLLPASVIEAIAKALRDYDPASSSIHLVVSGVPDDAYAGQYAWWTAPLIGSELAPPSKPARTQRGRPRK